MRIDLNFPQSIIQTNLLSKHINEPRLDLPTQRLFLNARTSSPLLLNDRRKWKGEEEIGVEEYVGTKPGASTEKGIFFQLKVVKKA